MHRKFVEIKLKNKMNDVKASNLNVSLLKTGGEGNMSKRIQIKSDQFASFINS